MITRLDVEAAGIEGAGICEEKGRYRLVNVLGKIPMYVCKQDKSVAPHLTNDGFWESWITTWILNFVRPGTVFWDVGANTGYYSFIAHVQGAQVCAYEPNPECYNLINKTIEYNRFNGIRVVKKALSDIDGVANLYVPAELHGSASLTAMDEKWDYRAIEVETMRFDSQVSCWGAGKQIMKIDAEGAEEKIFNGMGNRLVEVGKPIILMEYTPNAYSDKFLSALEDYAQLAWINYDGMEQLVTREWIESQTDWVMLVLRPR